MADLIAREYMALLRRALKKAHNLGLDTSAVAEQIDSEDIEPFERSSEGSEMLIKKLATAIHSATNRGLEWPLRMPLPVVTWSEEGNRFDVIDGNHRIYAAKRVGLPRIPVLMIDAAAFDAMVDAPDGIEGLTWIDVLGLEDPLIRKNLQLGLIGSRHHR